MKCSKLIDKLQRLDYELDDPNVVIKIGDEYDAQIEIRIEDYRNGKAIVIM
jgi:hypothetical protein